MGELLGLFVGLIVALIEVGVHLIALVLETLGFAVGYLGEKPKKDKSRFTARRLLVALAPLAVVVVGLVGVHSFVEWRAEVRREKTQATRKLVREHVDRLASQVDEHGHFAKHPAPTLDDDDAWGNALAVGYEQTLTHQVVEVRSGGADEELHTLDDVSSSRRLLRPEKEIALDLLVKAKGAIKERMNANK